MNKIHFVFLFAFLASFSLQAAESDGPSDIVNQTLVWPDGTRYVGGVRDGKRWGKGTIFWQDGTRFAGTFANDLRNGPGTMILPDGTVYNGYFQDDDLIEAPLMPVDSIIQPMEVTRSDTAVPASSEDSASAGPIDGDVGSSVPQLAINTSVPAVSSDTEYTISELAGLPFKPAAPPLVTTPETKAVITELDESVRTAVMSMVDLWAAAWSDKNVAQYLANYSEDFAVPGRQTRSEWEALRRSRLTRPNTIDVSVAVEKIEITAPDVVRVEFKQRYQSDLYRDETRKQLSVRKEGDSWRILSERSL